MDNDFAQLGPEERRAKLNLETARIAWRELQRYFAAGRVVRISPRLDLIDAALAIAEDDVERIRGWIDEGALAPVADTEALAWYESDAALWAVVVNPWVVVQSES